MDMKFLLAKFFQSYNFHIDDSETYHTGLRVFPHPISGVMCTVTPRLWLEQRKFIRKNTDIAHVLFLFTHVTYLVEVLIWLAIQSASASMCTQFLKTFLALGSLHDIFTRENETTVLNVSHQILDFIMTTDHI